ncbi:RNA methyltransferase [Fonsecaea pedrosoi]|nr:RNA methyltransferase [Fonsecaea pedrosoi]
MLQFTRHVLRFPRAIKSVSTHGPQPARCISLTGAIEKGIRRGQQSRNNLQNHYTKPTAEPQQDRDHLSDSLNTEGEDGQKKEVIIPGEERRRGQKRRKGPRTVQPGQDVKGTRSARSDRGVPASIPYTTAGSEFLYGTFSVLSALTARRRKLHKLYRLLPPGYDKQTKRAKALQPKESLEQIQTHKKIHNLAEKAGIDVTAVQGPRWQGVFAKASDGRPHNGWILEASPIPKLPVTSLSPVPQPSDSIAVTVGWASEEDREINTVFGASGSKATIPSVRPPNRYPFMLLLDCITDTGNFGAIVRSAWFLGVDAILILEHGTAPISTNSVKASAGAFEYMPILHIKNEREFIRDSRKNGWKFFAADAPEADGGMMRRIMQQKGQKALGVAGSLSKHPCVLVLGNEETGIREFMRTMVDGVAGIPNARPDVGDIDSLNVSVAAALLTQKFFDTAHPELDTGRQSHGLTSSSTNSTSSASHSKGTYGCTSPRGHI